MGCAATQLTVVAARFDVACADNFVPPRPRNLIHPITREYMFEGGPVRVCDDVWGRYWVQGR